MWLDGRVLRAECLPDRGMLVRSLVDRRSGTNLLWERSVDPGGRAARDLGPAGAESVSTWADRLFIGGWFEMFPSAGHPGVVDGRPTYLHGEAPRLPWAVVRRSAAAVTAGVDLVADPVHAERTVELTDTGIAVSSTYVNVGTRPVAYTRGEHPCLSRVAFAGGRIEVRARRAWTPAPPADAAAAALVPGVEFSWPHSPATAGGELDVAALPAAADGRHDHACLELADAEVRVTAPRLGLAVELRFDLADYPYLLLWENFAAPGTDPDDVCDVFGLEPTSAPGRSADDAVAARAVRHLAPGETRTYRLELVVTDLIRKWTSGGRRDRD
jgi:galactose mutarotase-like enzyme